MIVTDKFSFPIEWFIASMHSEQANLILSRFTCNNNTYDVIFHELLIYGLAVKDENHSTNTAGKCLLGDSNINELD